MRHPDDHDTAEERIYFQSQMSDQTDIERIAEKHARHWAIRADFMTEESVHETLHGALTEYAALRDEEAARLKADYSNLSLTTSEDASQLRARLAEATQKFQLYRETNNADKARQLSLCQRMRDAAIVPIESLQAHGTPGRVIGMRCKLCNHDAAIGVTLEHDSDCPLSSPLDLELLNRVSETFRPFVQYPDELRDTDTISVTVTGDQMLAAAQLLKSLSPA